MTFEYNRYYSEFLEVLFQLGLRCLNQLTLLCLKNQVLKSIFSIINLTCSFIILFSSSSRVLLSRWNDKHKIWYGIDVADTVQKIFHPILLASFLCDVKFSQVMFLLCFTVSTHCWLLALLTQWKALCYSNVVIFSNQALPSFYYI